MSEQPVALLLAAGSGLRLGRGPKALLPYGDETLVARAVRAARSADCGVVVTVGPEPSAVQEQVLSVDPRAEIVQLVTGASMAESFRVGVRRIVAAVSGDAPVVILLVDQPGIDAEVIARLLRAHRGGRVTRACWSGTAGHPVVLGNRHAQEAAVLAEGDAGARVWLRAHASLIDQVECGDLARGDDVDTVADLRTWPQLRVARFRQTEQTGTTGFRDQ